MVHGLLVEGIDHGRLHGAASGADRLCNPVKWRLGTAGNEYPRPFPREGTGHGAPIALPPPKTTATLCLSNITRSYRHGQASASIAIHVRVFECKK